MKRMAMIVSALAISVAGFVIKPAEALGRYPYAVPCNGCANPVIYSVLREEYGIQNSWYVYDLTTRRLRYFYKLGSGSGFTIREAAVDQATLGYWNEVLDFYDRNRQSLTLEIAMNIVVSTSGKMSLQRSQVTGALNSLSASPSATAAGQLTAWDAVNEGVYRQQVVNYLNNNSQQTQGGYFSRAAELVGTTYAKISTVFGGQSADQMRVSIEALGLTLVARFPDGSSQKYSWDPIGHTWAYVPHTSVDSSGNTIPDGPADVSGQNGNAKIYSFPGTPAGAANAIDWFQRVNLMFHINAPSPKAPAVLACVTSSGGTTCRLHN